MKIARPYVALMRLLDLVAASTKPLHVLSPSRGLFALPSAAAIAADVRHASHRYVLDDDVAALVMRTALGDTPQILKCVDLVRIPAPLLWLEWNERGAFRAMAELGVAPNDAMRATCVGLLVRSDLQGRSGDFSIVWRGDEAGPDLSPVRVEFNLDDTTFADSNPDGSAMRSMIIPQDKELTRLLCHARFRLAREWNSYLRAVCPTALQYEQAFLANLRMVANDFPFLVAFCLVMASRSALALRPSELARLNASRAKTGKRPLLDHIEATAQLNQASAADRSGNVAGRASARLHFVCGHLVRRGERVFWRRAHLRGEAKPGVIASRTVFVRVRHALAPNSPTPAKRGAVEPR